MLRTHSANLTKEERQRIDPDFLANEEAYFRMRDSLLDQYAGQWVAVHDDHVIAAGSNPLQVMDAAALSGGHPYVALVGAEERAVFRVRRATFQYDQSYQPFALPRIAATFWNHAATHSQTHDDVIPDTGADISVLPQADCRAIALLSSPYLTGMTAGVTGPSRAALIYRGQVEVDGVRCSALIQPLHTGVERIVGRDVLNQQRVLFDGPAGQVIIGP